MKPTSILATLLACSPTLLATDKDKTSAPIVIPLTGSGQATTSKLGSSFHTRGDSGAAWSTSPQGSSFITRGTTPKKDEKTTRVIVIPESK